MKRKERGAALFRLTAHGGCKWKESTYSCSQWLDMTLVQSYLQLLETSSLNTHTHAHTHLYCCIKKTKAGSKGENTNTRVIQDSCLCSTHLFLEFVSSLCCDGVWREGVRWREEKVTGH